MAPRRKSSTRRQAYTARDTGASWNDSLRWGSSGGPARPRQPKVEPLKPSKASALGELDALFRDTYGKTKKGAG